MFKGVITGLLLMAFISCGAFASSDKPVIKDVSALVCQGRSAGVELCERIVNTAIIKAYEAGYIKAGCAVGVEEEGCEQNKKIEEEIESIPTNK
ncbi:hypothetical protein ACX1H4_13910 [Yersinia enterocolitica]|uniref:hypothetical protein n=1 Tax=Yersinia enterocolitica TaxID=630 RepID=UPI0028BBC8D6|nr:hypothetical protein [Yersinia enterocolitica]EKN6076249.1 hypothetical protein [Yersinia enterocolitica]ELI8122247.1 hypothetical protein [Yersinia enterocolitica]HDL6593694.1 hypothetical protein [Yersinia enterocolitica]HDL7589993.1 hypothetical protein [Yersinia enterocolitica]